MAKAARSHYGGDWAGGITLLSLLHLPRSTTKTKCVLHKTIISSSFIVYPSFCLTVCELLSAGQNYMPGVLALTSTLGVITTSLVGLPGVEAFRGADFVLDRHKNNIVLPSGRL